MKDDHLTEEEILAFIENPTPEVANHLEGCDSCKETAEELKEVLLAMEESQQVTPPTTIAYHLAAAIAEQKKSEEPKRQIQSWQIAASISILIVGFLLGKWSQPDFSRDVIALEAKVSLLKEMSTMNTLQVSTASQRIQAVNKIEENTATISAPLLRTLLNTLNTDESPNVRYAAAQALGRFEKEERVRLALAKSLENQTDALIQIAIISMLVEADEKSAIKPIKQLMNKEATSPEVKQQAEVALNILI